MSPRRRLGQHFLGDRNAVRAIANALAPGADDVVVEIGPGRGALTLELVRRAGRVVAVELDPELAALVGRDAPAGLVVVHDDVLRRTFRETANAAGAPSAGALLVAGNLPYSISKPIAMKLVRERDDVARAVLMFQREVALRLTAEPGGRDYGPLAVLARRVFDVRRLFDLPPGAFRPAPRVWSTVTLWERRPDTRLDRAAEGRLRRCLAVSFARRRRTLHNNLRAVEPDAARVDGFLAKIGVDGAMRPERVSPEQYDRMAQAWPELEEGHGSGSDARE
jgi:16S rRNA (adenine1518-N6/adenine1519-N6)-dimethyltransferase